MVPFLHPRIRIGIVIVSAFFISGLLMNYSVGETETEAPLIQIKNITNDIAQSLSDSKTHFLASIQSLRLLQPTPSPTLTPPDQILTAIPTVEPTAELPIPEVPTSIPIQTAPTYALFPTPRISVQPTQYIPLPTTRIPTAIPKPTKIPQPTKIPKPTKIPPPPPITSDIRPGTSIEAILREVSKHACIPYALLMATRTEESGAWMNNMSATTTKKYNTYGWWKSASGSEICAALAYSTQSGLIPSDSGGGSCTNGVQPGAYDQQIMGLMQMSKDEQEVTRKYTTPSLPKNIDRRVLFDNALIYAYATKNRAGDSPQPSCDDWPEETVKLVAEKHFGACGYSGGNYCTEIWNLYKSFR